MIKSHYVQQIAARVELCDLDEGVSGVYCSYPFARDGLLLNVSLDNNDQEQVGQELVNAANDVMQKQSVWERVAPFHLIHYGYKIEKT